MTIIELLERVGVENVKVQTLDDAISNISLRKDGGSAVTFLTREINPNQVAAGGGPFCMIVWMPRDKALAAAKQSPTPKGNP